MLPGMVNLKGSNPICYCLVDALIRNILLLCQQSRTQEIHSYTHIFFFRVCPLFFEIERFMGQVTLFLAFIEFCLGLSVLPSTLAIKAFLFKDSFHFCLLPPSPFLFYFLFFSNFFVFSCDGHPAYTRFTYMGSSFASYSSSTESRSTAWSRDTSFCGYTHSPLRPGYRSG